MDELLQRLERIQSMLEEQCLLRKEVLNISEASKYLNMSISHLYKLTAANRIPHSQPEGKKIYFERKELTEWLKRNKKVSSERIEVDAANYIINKPIKQQKQ